MKALVAKGMKLDNIVLNAGMLKYPNVSGESEGVVLLGYVLARADRREQRATEMYEPMRVKYTSHDG